jgi:hypothetical protein
VTASQDTAPAALFVAPATAAPSTLTTAEYIEAVSQCIAQAASKDMIERTYRFGRPGRDQPQSLTRLGSARQLLQLLVEHDQNRRAWMVVEGIGNQPGICPEVNHCVGAIRAMLRRDAIVAVETENLLVLRGLVSTHGEPMEGQEP